MHVIEQFPHEVRAIENVWIPLADGCRLAARVWLPVAAVEEPVPAILEYIPYRKRDRTRMRDEPMHAFFAGHGYAAVRVDLRGSGDSEGVLLDEYLPQELDDGCEVLAWIAAQPWCNGRVGMIGKSWGGFSALQLAARQPPELEAVIAVCATDDRYADDAHYMGGCLLNENLIWGSVLLTLNALPPDPEIVGEDRWREMWLQRLTHTPLFPERWLRHPLRDAYWKHGSICEDYDRVRVPVYAISGWADGYSNAVPRLIERLPGPRKGLIGPWAHVYPHEGVPGPAIGFLQEALRWWDHWLRDRDSGILAEPPYRVWMQDGVRPRSFHDERPGRWVAEESWPSPRIAPREYRLAPFRLLTSSPSSSGAADGCGEASSGEADGCGEASSGEAVIEFGSPQSHGLEAGSWCGFGIEGEMPVDQRSDDGKSLVFDSETLDESFEILGAPALRLEIEVDRPRAFVVARLCDVGPDGASTRVSYGLLDLTHSDDHASARPLQPGQRRTARLQLNDAAHVFARGHRIRLALATTYWPMAWPSPEPVRLRVHLPTAALTLPVRPPREADAALRPFAPPAAAPGPVMVSRHPETGEQRRLSVDLRSGAIVYTVSLDDRGDGEPTIDYLEAIDLELGHSIIERFEVCEGDPLSARTDIRQKAVTRRARWVTEVETRVVLLGDRDDWRLEAELTARESGRPVFWRQWSERIPRERP